MFTVFEAGLGQVKFKVGVGGVAVLFTVTLIGLENVAPTEK